MKNSNLAEQVKAASIGRAVEILTAVAGLAPEILDGRQHPCSRCGGSDRFQLIDRVAGAVRCRGCFKKKNGDYLSAVQHFAGVSFPVAVSRVAEYLGISGNPSPSKPAATRAAKPTTTTPPPATADQTTAEGTASPELLDRAYQALLSSLSLSDVHRDALVGRGLNAEAIERNGYRTMPADGKVRSAAALAIVAAVGQGACLVPGMKPALKDLTCGAGLLIPVRNADGLIVAIRIRLDDPKADGKYRWLSSRSTRTPDGPSPGAPAHVPAGITKPASVARITEGELKADVATYLSGIATISFAGVDCWPRAIEAARELGATTIRVAFDADASTNENVAAALLKCFECIAKLDGIVAELETWDMVDGKGIDDLLAAGKQPQLWTGAAALDKAREIAAAAGAGTAKANDLQSQIASIIKESGPSAIYRKENDRLLDALATLAVKDAPAYSGVLETLKGAGLGMQGFSRAMRQKIERAVASQPAEFSRGETGGFFEAEGSVCRTRFTTFEPVTVPLANFVAAIVDETTRDDGQERRVMLGIVGRLSKGRSLPRIEVTAESFSKLDWIVPNWGSDAIVWPGEGRALPAAIQALSPEKACRTVYTHTGWRKIGDGWAYLHGGGAIGTQQAISVDLPTLLHGFEFPSPPTGDDLTTAIRASLNILDVAPGRDYLTIPALSAAFRAVLGSSDFAIHLSGPSGVFKSELTALIQQHFGAGLDARHLPGNWSSTGNALEGCAFAAKDAIFAIDDFAPNGGSANVSKLHQAAEQIFRSQGNHSGRQRMRADGSLRPAKPPRGLVFSTGEDVPRGQSLRARMLILDVGPGDIDPDRLTECQRHAAAGLYAGAMGAFIEWLAPQFEAISGSLKQSVAEFRDKATADGNHARTPGIVADLRVGMGYFLAFAEQAGAISAAEREWHKARCWAALQQAAASQAGQQSANEPATLFLRLLSAVIASGRGHLADVGGGPPRESAEAMGWGPFEVKDGSSLRTEWRPRGHKLGWASAGQVFLEPDASFAAVQRLATEQGESLSVTAATLRKRLSEKKLLASTGKDAGQDTITVRKSVEGGGRRHVLHMLAETLGIVPGANGWEIEPDGWESGQADGGRLSTESGLFHDENEPVDRLDRFSQPVEADSTDKQNRDYYASGF